MLYSHHVPHDSTNVPISFFHPMWLANLSILISSCSRWRSWNSTICCYKHMILLSYIVVKEFGELLWIILYCIVILRAWLVLFCQFIWLLLPCVWVSNLTSCDPHVQFSLQLGGSDQWGNMVCGVDLGRRWFPQAHSLTHYVLLTANSLKLYLLLLLNIPICFFMTPRLESAQLFALTAPLITMAGMYYFAWCFNLCN